MNSLYLGYFILSILFLGSNSALFLGQNRISTLKVFKSIILICIIFLLAILATFFIKNPLYFLNSYINWVFIICSVIIFVLSFKILKNNKWAFKSLLIVNLLLFVITLVLYPKLDMYSIPFSLLFILFLFVILFIVFKLSNLLHYAKREYYIIVGEFMIFEAILFFFLGLTYNACLNLDYSIFTSFIILTPLYQLIYVLIAIGFIFILGLLINDKFYKKKF